MRSRVRLAAVLLSCSLAVLASGCATPPVQEMSNARQAITAAEEAGAEEAAAPLLAEARALLASAEAKLQRENYIGARLDATSARIKAVEALEHTQQKQ
jgi:hypothetical protein